MFVPNADFGSRRETAIVLVGTAEENGLNVREIKTLGGGFEISEELAAILYPEDGQTKTSGNRAAKTTKSKED